MKILEYTTNGEKRLLVTTETEEETLELTRLARFKDKETQISIWGTQPEKPKPENEKSEDEVTQKSFI